MSISDYSQCSFASAASAPLPPISPEKTAMLCLGAVGLQALPEMLQLYPQWRRQCPTLPRVQLLLWADDTPQHTLAERLTALLTQLNTQAEAPLAQQLLRHQLLPVAHCQRLLLDKGRLCIDLYLNFDSQQLKSLVLAAPVVQQWYWYCAQRPNTAQVWQMARLSVPHCAVWFAAAHGETLKQPFMTAGFRCLTSTEILPEEELLQTDTIALAERTLLTTQASSTLLPYPHYSQQSLMGLNPTTQSAPVAIIGAGIAGAMLALSLAERGINSDIFCADAQPGDAASGNRQGALYPLLTPEADELNDFYQAGFVLSRQRIEQLLAAGHEVAHDFCGVLQTGFDERSRLRLQKIAQGQPWPPTLLEWLAPDAASQQAGVALDEAGIFYPLGGWVCPQMLTQAAIAQTLQISSSRLLCQTSIKAIEAQQQRWQLTDNAGKIHGPYAQVILASGSALTDFSQSQLLPVTPFRGQVSEIASNPQLAAIKTVLSAKGYLTPSWQQQHCLGASYVKDDLTLQYRAEEQLENLDKLRSSYPTRHWPETVEIGARARVGIRMVTRDHLPLLGPVPDFPQLQQRYEQLPAGKDNSRFWLSQAAPIHAGLFVLGGLGSRGICSAALSAEVLASCLCHEPLPVSAALLTRLNPNRIWLRRLLRGQPPR